MKKKIFKFSLTGILGALFLSLFLLNVKEGKQSDQISLGITSAMADENTGDTKAYAKFSTIHTYNQKIPIAPGNPICYYITIEETNETCIGIGLEDCYNGVVGVRTIGGVPMGACN